MNQELFEELKAQIKEQVKIFFNTPEEQREEFVNKILEKWQKENEELWKKFTDKFVKVEAGQYGVVNVTLPTKEALDNWRYWAEHDTVEEISAEITVTKNGVI